MAGLTNDYLDKLSRKLIGKSFYGVYSADGCSNVPRNKTFSIIFNIDLMKNPGLHFISIFFTPTKAYYFDSFGNNTIEPNIAKFILKTKRKCVMRCLAIQHVNSNFCGFYALAFLLWMSRKRQSSHFYDMFDVENLKNNDLIVTNFILKEIH